MLDEDLPIPLIPFYTDTNGRAILFQLFQKPCRIEMIVDIDFHAFLLVKVRTLVIFKTYQLCW
jgi:hypothetical protein